MKCQYCGRENPDGETFCECGRPLRLGSTSPATASSGGYTPSPDSPFAYQTLDSVKRTRSVPWKPIIVLVCALIGVGVFFGLRWLQHKHITDESSWQTIDRPMYSINVPSDMDKGDMLTISGSSFDLLDFYTSRLAGFDVYVHRYTDTEKKDYGGLTAAQFTAVQQLTTTTINGQVLQKQLREGKEYCYSEYKSHNKNYIKKSEELWYIQALFPTANGCYIVDVYCAEEDKDEYRESMLKWLDSFKPKI